MKKVMTLLGISLVATAIVDVTFPLRITSLSFATAIIVFFLASYLFYNRIIEKPVLNSFLVLFFLFALMSFGYVVNFKEHNRWTLFIVCAVTGYLAGLATKRKISQNACKAS